MNHPQKRVTTVQSRSIAPKQEEAMSPMSGRDRDDGSRDRFPRRRPKPPVDLLLDYKDVETLKSFLTEGGRIVPAKVSRLSRKQQRTLTREVKRARQLALLPVSDRHPGPKAF